MEVARLEAVEFVIIMLEIVVVEVIAFEVTEAIVIVVHHQICSVEQVTGIAKVVKHQ